MKSATARVAATISVFSISSASARTALVSAGIALGMVVLTTPSHATTYNYVQTIGGGVGVVNSNNTVQVSDLTTLPNGSTALAPGVLDILVTLDTTGACLGGS